MATTFLFAFVCFSLIQVGQCALPACTDAESTGCPANATCTASGEQCTCSTGFHEAVDTVTCAADIPPGAACTTKDTDTECVDDATCKNVAAEGSAEDLKCSCNQGFHKKTPSGGENPTCEADIQPEGACTTRDSEAECVDGATCRNVAAAGQAEVLQCSCKSDFHQKTSVGGSPVCEADIPPGAACTTKDTDTECVDDATCKNVAAEGSAEDLKCSCNQGFYKMTPSGGGNPTCEADIQPGGACTTKDSEAECVDGATCRNVAAAEQAEVLQCSCKSDFHQKTPVGGSPVCEADFDPGVVCSVKDSADECKEGSTCTEVTGQVGVLQCTCNAGSHKTTTSAGIVACQPDIQPGSACTTENATTECVNNATCKNGAETGATASLKCTCNTGFHVMTNSAAGTASCQADIEPGGTCTTLDAATECVDDATCKSVTEAEAATTLQCTCNTGFHVMTDSAAGTSSCQADIDLGSPCTMTGSDVECAGNDATCINTAQEGQTPVPKCICKTGFHMKGTPSVCEADIVPGGTCTVIDTDSECVEGALCQNAAAAGSQQLLQCTCKENFHIKSVDGKATCEGDLSPGQPCSQENDETECVKDAACKNSQAAGQTAELKCMCNSNFHEADGEAGFKICVADTCQHTKDKCMAAGTTNCAEVNAFIGCMLNGACNPADPEQMQQFKVALMEARTKLPADCAFTSSTTCTDKVTGCLNTYLKAEVNCTNTEVLGICLSAAQPMCTTDAESYKLADTYLKNASEALSCACVKEAGVCLETETTKYGADGADAAAKCNAVKNLYTCALTTNDCDLSKDIDNRVLSTLWSQANTWAGESGCKDTLTEEAANTCPLQLTRCAINYAGGKQASGEDKAATCRVTEMFGSCLADKTPECREADTATKAVFTQQYTLASSTCACFNHLMMCHNAVGVLPTDAAVVCPKLATYSRCVLGAKCNLGSEHADLMGLKKAFDWYNQRKSNYSCQTTSDGKCAQDTAVCSDTLVTALSKEGITTKEKCSATADSVLCVNAANCSKAITEDAALLTSSRDAATFRLQSLGCTEPPCHVTQQELQACKATYEASFTAASADNSKKCTAQNEMVKCLRRFKCNPHLDGLVQLKYDALKGVNVPSCDLLSLEEDTSVAAPSLHSALPVLLASLAVAVAAVRM